jgi:hypothetical protein
MLVLPVNPVATTIKQTFPNGCTIHLKMLTMFDYIYKFKGVMGGLNIWNPSNQKQKMSSLTIFKCGFTILAVGAFSQIVHADVLFDNLATPLGFFNSGASEVGDEIVFAGGSGATITSFKFEYFGSNFVSGTEQAEVLFYANDSSSLSAGYPKPNSVLWDSGPFSIPDTFNATLETNALVTFDTSDLGGGVAVPGDFTWAVVFTGIATNESAGPILSSTAPTTGSDYNDYWLNTGTVDSPNWQLETNATLNIDFVAQVSDVPEPPAFSLFGIGSLIGLIGLAFKRLLVRT